MAVGRGIYGTGMISMIITSSMIVFDWFPTPLSNTAWGIYMSVSGLAICLSAVICPAIFDGVNPSWETVY